MPRLTSQNPSYRRHKASGQAVVTLAGQDVYLGPHARGEHERAHDTVRRIFEHVAERGDSEDEIRAFVSGMTDRYALTFAESLR